MLDSVSLCVTAVLGQTDTVTFIRVLNNLLRSCDSGSVLHELSPPCNLPCSFVRLFTKSLCLSHVCSVSVHENSLSVLQCLSRSGITPVATSFVLPLRNIPSS